MTGTEHPSTAPGHRRRRIRSTTVVVALALGVLGAAARGGGAVTARGPAVTAVPVAAVAGVTALTTRAGDPGVWATTKAGQVLALRAGADPVVALDLTARVRTVGEGGLLGLAFSPDGGRLFLAHSDLPDGRMVLSEHAVAAPPAVTIDDPGGRVLLTQPHPSGNHFGGHLATGPDGLLWLGLGDGGGDTRVSGPNARDPRTWLGKVLRIDPRPAAGAPFSPPADNPFADGGGRPEIAVLGLRNPWSFSFDPATGALWIADVGQDSREEVNRLPARRILGADLGWNVFEGRARFTDGAAPDAVPPLLELRHDDGHCAVIGGVVVRDTDVAALRDRYLFGDHCSGRLLAVGADARRPRIRDLGLDLPGLTAFTRAEDGTVYAATIAGGIVRLDAA